MSELRYHIDNTARLTLAQGEAMLTLEAAQVNELVEFLGAIAFKGLAQRLEARSAGSLPNPLEGGEA